MAFAVLNKLRKLRKFHEIKAAAMMNLIVGNGLLLQLGYATSSLDIYDLMVELYPALYRPIKKRERKRFELESILHGKSRDDMRRFKMHFAEALITLVGDPSLALHHHRVRPPIDNACHSAHPFTRSTTG